MKRSILIFLSCIALPVYAADFSAYVPKGWKIIKSVKGDLNGDNQADAVLVLQTYALCWYIMPEEGASQD